MSVYDAEHKEEKSISVDLGPALSPCDVRKIADVLTNLGFRMGTVFVRTTAAPSYGQHKIDREGHRLVWNIDGKKHHSLSANLEESVSILSFAHLKPDIANYQRPLMSGYDPRTPFLEQIFDRFCQDLTGRPLFSGMRNAPLPAIVQVTHDIDNPQLLTPYQIGRSIALLLRGQRCEAETLKAAFQALWHWKASDPFWCFDCIDELGREYGFRSTFFSFARYPGSHKRDPKYSIESIRYRENLLSLEKAENEIGYHSGINYNDFSQPREQFPGADIRSHRAHYWAAPTLDLEQWLDSMARSGITADASTSPQESGTLLGMTYPLSYTTKSGLKILLYPSQFMDAYCMNCDTHNDILETIGQYTITDLPSVINMNWHIRVFSNVGVWKGYGERFRTLLNAIVSKFSVSFMTMSESTEFFRGKFDDYEFKA